MAVTIKDIAKIAGVTHSTVSRCLNDRPGVSDKMRQEIKKIAADLEFEFNANARGLNTSRTGTIGVILEEERDRNDMHFFTNAVLSEIRCSLEKRDLDMLTSYYRNSHSKKDNIIKMINRKKVDGLILLCSSIKKETVKFLKETSTPFVFAHQIPKKLYGKVNSVYCDHKFGSQKAVQYLIDQGRRNILCVCRNDNKKEFRLRTKGYKKALEDNDLPFNEEYLIPAGYDWNSSVEAMRSIHPLMSKVDGIFAHTDLIAMGLLREFKKEGIHIPKDIALMGYDNIELCTFLEPQLSTVEQPIQEISDKACQNLFDQLDGNHLVRTELIKPKLILRGTT